MTSSELPARWRLTTIGEIAREKLNNGIFRKNPEYLTNGSEGFPVVWVEELFRGNSINTKDCRRVSATKSEIEKYGLKHGDVLFCRSSLKLDGIAFNNVYLGEDSAALFECHLIRVSPNLEDVSPVFLNWLLRSPQFRAVAKSKSKTATMTTIDQQSLASIPIPLPPLAEQRRIAKVLDRAEALRAKRRTALAQLDSLTQSIFLDLFGDPVTNRNSVPVLRMGDVCDVRDGTHDSPKYVSAGGYPLVTSKNLSGGFVDLSDVNYISEADYIQINRRSKVDRGDIIMPMIGTIGSPVLVEDEPRYAIKNVALIKFTKSSPLSVFVRHLLSCHYFDHVLGQKNRGGTQKFVSLGDLRSFPLPLPSVELQREFANRVGAVEKLKAAQRASLAELDALFVSVQHRAFRGEL